MVLANGAPIDIQHLLFDDIQSISSFDSRVSQPQDNLFDQSAPPRSFSAPFSMADTQAAPEALNETVKHSEWQAIMSALNGCRSREHAAEQLGISPRTLRHKLQRLREQGINVTRAYAR